MPALAVRDGSPPSPRGGPGPAERLAERLRRPDSFSVFVEVRARAEAGAREAQRARGRIADCAAAGLIDGCFVCGGADAGAAALSSLLALALDHGLDPVVSLSLAACDRGAALERARSWAAAGAAGMLVVTGDCRAPGPGAGPGGFDIDSLQALLLLRARDADPSAAPRALGCVVSPFKRLESELMWQYARLRRKVEAGADFVVCQAGFDPRAWDELARYCRLAGIAQPLIGSVLVPDARLARRIAAGLVPGVSVAPALLRRLAGEDPAAGLRLAGRAVAVLRGLGYRGALLCGRPLAADEARLVAEEAERARPDWRRCLGEFGEAPPRFGYFRRDERTGLNQDRLGPVRRRGWPRPIYGFSYAIDHLLFGPVEPVFRLLTRVCRFCDAHGFWGRALWLAEWLTKAPLYRCRMCGDCTLYACGFFCSESGCPKRLVNGPCGGSTAGRCEVPGAGTCLWVKVYDRLKSRVERPGFAAPAVRFKDRGLAGSCSWINFCLGRDHRGARTRAASSTAAAPTPREAADVNQ